MFVNYLLQPRRRTPLNTAIARVVVGAVAIWKLLSYHMGALADWPQFLFDRHAHGRMAPFGASLDVLGAEVWLTVALLALFAIGLWTAATGLAAAALLTHMVAIHYVVTNSGSTFLPWIYAILLLALYRADDPLSADGLRRAWRRPLDELDAELGPGARRDYRAMALAWILLLVAVIYFFTGYAKLMQAGLSWANAANLNMMIHREAYMHLGELPFWGKVFLDHPLLAAIGAWATLLLECGFVFCILLTRTIWPVVLGLLGLHTAIAVSMGIFFFDQYLLFAAFCPWDRWLAASARGAPPPEVVYDARCRRCAVAVWVLTLLDVRGELRVQASGDPDVAGTIRAGAHEGRDALAALAGRYRLLAPLARVLGRGARGPLRA